MANGTMGEGCLSENLQAVDGVRGGDAQAAAVDATRTADEPRGFRESDHEGRNGNVTDRDLGKTLYLDCASGIAGDMFVAALLDLGGEAAEAAVCEALAGLPVSGFDVRVSRVSKSGIDCCDFDVELDAGHDGHDHDMAYLHGREHGHAHGHASGGASACETDAHAVQAGKGDHASACAGEGHCAQGRAYAHESSHGHTHTHAHEHRNLADIEAIIDAAALTPAARAFARCTFHIVAEAEAKAHGLPVEQVHFHEVGAADSIVDVVSAAVLVDYLNITRVVVPALTDGCGTIRCQHGVIPVPVPATLNICMAHGLPLSSCEVEGELVTPTGAAIVAALEPEFALPERYVVEAVGLGAGKRTYERPSILRAMFIREQPRVCPVGRSEGYGSEALQAPHGAGSMRPAATESSFSTSCEPQCAQGGAAVSSCIADAAHVAEPQRAVGAPGLSIETDAPAAVVKLECEIDDATPEVLAYAAERLRESGAREVHWLPAYCKKGRPAWQLQVICAEADVEPLQNIVFAETTTNGIRRQRMERTCLERRFERAATPWGEVSVKVATLPDGSERRAPEYEDCAHLARENDIPLQRIMQAALNQGQDL